MNQGEQQKVGAGRGSWEASVPALANRVRKLQGQQTGPCLLVANAGHTRQDQALGAYFEPVSSALLHQVETRGKKTAPKIVSKRDSGFSIAELNASLNSLGNIRYDVIKNLHPECEHLRLSGWAKLEKGVYSQQSQHFRASFIRGHCPQAALIKGGFFFFYSYLALACRRRKWREGAMDPFSPPECLPCSRTRGVFFVSPSPVHRPSPPQGGQRPPSARPMYCAECQTCERGFCAARDVLGSSGSRRRDWRGIMSEEFCRRPRGLLPLVDALSIGASAVRALAPACGRRACLPCEQCGPRFRSSP